MFHNELQVSVVEGSVSFPVDSQQMLIDEVDLTQLQLHQVLLYDGALLGEFQNAYLLVFHGIQLSILIYLDVVEVAFEDCFS